MKRRFIYSVLIGIPGFFVSLIISAVLFGAAAGALWIFVFGDNPWPAWAEQALPVLFVLIFLLLWIGLVIAGYWIGKGLEQRAALNKAHVLISAGVTVLFILVIFLYQVSVGNVGNVGPKSDEARCSEFCTEKGYSASSVSPRNSSQRTCRCLGNTGGQIITVPMESLGGAK